MKRIISLVLISIMIASAAFNFNIFAHAHSSADINIDGEVDNKDVVTLFRYVSGTDKIEDNSIYDFNGDGDVNNKDVVELFRALSNGEAFESITDEEINGESSEISEDETEEQFESITDEEINGESSEISEEEETEEQVPENIKYDIFLYASGEGSEPNDNIDQYTGKDYLGIAEETKKDNMEDKTVSIFGKEYTLKYTRTLDFGIYDEKYDRYGNNGISSFTFGEKTGRLVSYTNYSDEPGEGFESPINAHSSRKDFIEYAKALLLESFGTSTDDCDVIIKTRKLKTTYKYTAEDLKQDFINFINYDPNFSAEYQIIFYKKFSGAYRIDDIEVDISSDGRVRLIKSRTCDEKFEIFKDVKIPAKSLRKKVENISDINNYLSYDIIQRVIPDGDELWMITYVTYTYKVDGDTLRSGTQYITKVADLKENPAEPDDTEETSVLESEFESEAISEDESEDESVYESEDVE